MFLDVRVREMLATATAIAFFEQYLLVVALRTFFLPFPTAPHIAFHCLVLKATCVGLDAMTYTACTTYGKASV